MSDEKNLNGASDSASENESEQKTGSGSESRFETREDAEKYALALEKRLQEREADATKFREELQAIRQAQKQRMEQEGNHKELYQQTLAELESARVLAERAETYEKAIRESNARRVEAIPEQYRSAVPKDYAPHQLAQWLDTNESVFKRPAPPPSDAGMGGNGSSRNDVQITDQDRALAQSARNSGYNVTAEQIAKRRMNRDQGVG